MQLGSKEIRRILEKYRDVFMALENYDRTRALPFQRKRIDITLSVETISKLKELSKKTGKPVSRLIEKMAGELSMPMTKTGRKNGKPEQIPEAIEQAPIYIG